MWPGTALKRLLARQPQRRMCFTLPSSLRMVTSRHHPRHSILSRTDADTPSLVTVATDAGRIHAQPSILKHDWGLSVAFRESASAGTPILFPSKPKLPKADFLDLPIRLFPITRSRFTSWRFT